LIIPRKHIPGLLEMEVDDQETVGHAMGIARQLAVKNGVSDSGFRIVVNSGPDAGQTIQHFHLHLLGGRPLGWPQG
jgi:histidine triad (HIT) family protein